MMKISVVIPVYNASKSITTLFDRMIPVLNDLSYEWQLIVVDDCSKDNSWNVLQEWKSRFPDKMKIIKLAKNFGQHNATLCGFTHADGDLIVTIDDDLEMSPEDIPSLISKIEATDSDLVYGEFLNEKRSFIRRVLTKLYKKISRLEGPDKGRGSSFRVLSKRLKDKILSGSRFFTFIDEVALWYSSKIEFVPVMKSTSLKGNSGYSLFRLSSLTTEIMMFSTVIPLRIVSFLGFLLVSINFPIGIYYLIKKIFFQSMLGYTSIIVSILFSTGLILFGIGIIAEYMSKIIRSQNGKPVFFEDQIL